MRPTVHFRRRLPDKLLRPMGCHQVVLSRLLSITKPYGLTSMMVCLLYRVSRWCTHSAAMLRRCAVYAGMVAMPWQAKLSADSSATAALNHSVYITGRSGAVVQVGKASPQAGAVDDSADRRSTR